MYYQKNYKDFIPRVSTKNYRYSKLWLEHTLKLNKILHFAPDFQPLILYYSLLASTFFSYTHYFSAKEPKAKNWARTGFLFQSQLSWGFLINECLLPLRERSYYYWLLLLLVLLSRTHNSILFDSVPSLASIPLLYYQIRVGSKNSIWKKAKKSLKCRLEFELFWVTLWRYIRLFSSFHYWIISFFLVMTCFQNFYGNKESKYA